MKRLFTSLICGLVGINAIMTAETGRPRLVVGIVIDQLRTDYIEYLQSLFGEKGFRRLMKNGVYLKDIDFKAAPLDAVSATAMIYTGSYPYASGVSRQRVWDPVRKELTPPLFDREAIGNFSSEAYSPAALRVSTIGDEIAIDGAGVSAVYSLAADPQQAVIMAGHAGSSAFWIADSNGKWATSSYYKDVPSVITARNYSNSIASRIDTMQWRPSMALERYPGVPAQKKYYPFRHTFPRSDRDVYKKFAASPLSNSEITELAVEYLDKVKLGNRADAIDMLSLAYTAAPFKYVRDGDYRLELEDTYLRLDSQLGVLFDAIDRTVGLDNTLVFLTGTGYYDDSARADDKYRIPGGEFSTRRAMSLLNSFLSAKYGNGDYVDTYYDGHVYLDHKTIDGKRLDIGEVSQSARDFLSKMSGVRDVRALADIVDGKSSLDSELRLIFDPKTGGDLYVTFAPGWDVTDDSRYPSDTRNVRQSMVTTPAFLMGPAIAPTVITIPVDAVRLAPTVTQRLRIRSPNGSMGRPFTF